MEIGSPGSFPTCPGVLGLRAERTAPSLRAGDGPGLLFQSGDYLVPQNLRGIRKASEAAPQSMGNFERTIITRLSAREVGDENSGDGGWHVLSLYCLPGVSALHILHHTLPGHHPHFYNN